MTNLFVTMVNVFNAIIRLSFDSPIPFKWSENLQTNYVVWRDTKADKRSCLGRDLYPVQGEPLLNSFIAITSNHSYEEYKFNKEHYCYEWVGGRGLGIGQTLNL